MPDGGPRRLVLMTEGHGDGTAVAAFVKRLLTEQSAWADLSLDANPLRVSGVPSLSGRNQRKLVSYVQAAAKRPNTAAVLLVLDGDADKFEGRRFCAKSVAIELAQRAKDAGAGATFSFACVLVVQEFETWLIGGIESLAGRALGDAGELFPAGLVAPPDLQGCNEYLGKGWIQGNITSSKYRETQHQSLLAREVEFAPIRARRLRSFRRLESALQSLLTAVRSGVHDVSPVAPQV